LAEAFDQESGLSGSRSIEYDSEREAGQYRASRKIAYFGLPENKSETLVLVSGSKSQCSKPVYKEWVRVIQLGILMGGCFQRVRVLF
jgi:hypothetical protein